MHHGAENRACRRMRIDERMNRCAAGHGRRRRWQSIKSSLLACVVARSFEHCTFMVTTAGKLSMSRTAHFRDELLNTGPAIGMTLAQVFGITR
jgi:hypothetical protein